MKWNTPHEAVFFALEETRDLEKRSKSDRVVYGEFEPEGDQVDISFVRSILGDLSVSEWQAMPDRLAQAYATLRKNDQLYWSEILDVRFALEQALEWMEMAQPSGAAAPAALGAGPLRHWIRNRSHAGQCVSIAEAEGPSTLSAGKISREEDRGNNMGFIGEVEGSVVSMSSVENQLVHGRYLIHQLEAHPHLRELRVAEHIDALLELKHAHPTVAAVVGGERKWLQAVLRFKGFRETHTVPNFYKTPEGSFNDAVVMTLGRK